MKTQKLLFKDEMPQVNCKHIVIPHPKKMIRLKKCIDKHEGYFQIQNRRFLGNKFKLLPFIDKVIQEKCKGFNSLCDIFAGTGMGNLKFNHLQYEKI